MSATQAPQTSVAKVGGESRPADVLVVFGITGDLAKVMTFRSLYRLELRGLLDCPIVGVAVDDWSVEQLVERARGSIVGTGEQLDEDVFKRLADRFSYVAGDFADSGHVRSRGRGDRGGECAGLLPRDPSVPVRQGRAGPCRGRPDDERSRSRGEAVRPRPGLGSRPRAGVAPVHRREPAPAHRPLPREDGDRGDHPPALREHAARARVEPQLRLLGADHDGRGLRRRGSRPLLRPRRRSPRRRRQPPHAGRLPVRDGGRRRVATPGR